MTEAMTGLFGPSPYEIEQQRRAASDDAAQKFAQMNATQRGVMGMYQGGAGLARAGAGMFGMVDPAVQNAQRTEQIMGQGDTDLSSSAGMLAKAEQFRKAGDLRTATALAMKGNEMKAKENAERHIATNEALAEKRFQVIEQGNLEDRQMRTEAAIRQVDERIADGRTTAAEKIKLEREKLMMMNEWKRIGFSLQQLGLSLKGDEAKAAGGGGKLTPITDEAGNVTMVNTTTGVSSPVMAGIGKPSTEYSKRIAKNKQTVIDLNTTVSELTDAIKPNGLLDKSTSSGAGALYDASAGFFGQSTEGAEAADALAPIADMVLKMVPRFEGSQSDADVKNYKEAAGQLANRNIPTARRKAAANVIIKLMNSRKNQFIHSSQVGTPDDPILQTVPTQPSAAPAPVGTGHPADIQAILNKQRGGK